jgi:hypothetical protein
MGFLSFLTNWPFNDIVKLTTLIGLIYYGDFYSKNKYLRLLARIQNYQANKKDNDEKLNILKSLLFNKAFEYISKSNTKVNIIEIGIGCGNNFKFYKNGK